MLSSFFRLLKKVNLRTSLYVVSTFPLATTVIAQECDGRCFRKSNPIEVAKYVDLNRIYGKWYIVATIPNLFEKGLVEPCDIYSPSKNGGIREDFYVRKGNFAAPIKHFVAHDRIETNSNNARWHVQPFWPVNLPFLVLYVDPDYRYILFGEENRSLGWIFAREQSIDDSTYNSLLNEFKIRGYNVRRFRHWIQKPEQIGKDNFWSNGVSLSASKK